MNRTWLTVLTVGLLWTVPAFAEDTRAKDVEKSLATLNDAFESGDKAKIKSLMAADHISVTSYYGGPLTRDEQLESMKDLKLSKYSVAKMQTTLLDKETALVTYEVTQQGTFRGMAVPVKSFASAVWVKRDGTWIERFYQETALGGK